MICALVAVLATALPATELSAAADTDVGPAPGHFFVEGERRSQSHGQSNSDGPAGSIKDNSSDVSSLFGFGPCFGAAGLIGVDLGEFCYGDGEPAAPTAELTLEMVASALRRVPLPPSELVIQPPDGRTLVNFETNFYTPERTLYRTVTLLGQQVELRIDASRYTWHFGDGDTTSTEKPGAPYPELTVTHNYLRTGRYAPSLDTTYVADFRVGDGPWREVPGSVTIEGPPASLRAVEATPTLVGYSG